MRRREFITILAGAVTVPFSARAQRSERPRRLGVLMSTAEDDPQQRSSINSFVEILSQRGWTVGRNLEILYRWASGEAQRMVANARRWLILHLTCY